jgi:hypothetical protein
MLTAVAESRQDDGVTAMVVARHNDGVRFVLETLSTRGARLLGPLALALEEQIRVLLSTDEVSVDLEADVFHVQRVDLLTDRIAVRFRKPDSDKRKAILTILAHALQS